MASPSRPVTLYLANTDDRDVDNVSKAGTGVVVHIGTEDEVIDAQIKLTMAEATSLAGILFGMVRDGLAAGAVSR